MDRGRLMIRIVGGCLVVLILAAARFHSVNDIGHDSIQLHLRLYGSAIYESQARTGAWPARAEDLAHTSLPGVSPYWLPMLEDGVVVILWPRDLKPEPKDNTRVILAYHTKGLLSHLSRVWVCWGDLRTEYLKVEDVRAYLQARR